MCQATISFPVQRQLELPTPGRCRGTSTIGIISCLVALAGVIVLGVFVELWWLLSLVPIALVVVPTWIWYSRAKDREDEEELDEMERAELEKPELQPHEPSDRVGR